MKLSYTLSEEDFLQHQLYLASNSQRIRKKEQRAWKLISFIFSLIGVILYLTDTAFPLGPFAILFGFITVLFYPLYVKKHYKDHYKNFIQENYQNRIGFPTEVALHEAFLFMKDKSGEGKIDLSELEYLIEIQQNFFLRLKSGHSLIFPKAQIQDLPAFRKSFQDIDVQVEPDLDWERKFLGLPNLFTKASPKIPV
ncbi:MAG: hypothetical protein R8P61_05970 [Bacteroidia bacterium]|nr:hypothetical protein [Bacteroidia bacterium]